MVQIVRLVSLVALLAGETCATTATPDPTTTTTRPTQSPKAALLARSKQTAAESTGRSSGEPAKPKLMVVFASRAGDERSTESSPRTVLMFDDAQVDRRSDVPDEPSSELLPPLQGDSDADGRAAASAFAKDQAGSYGYTRPGSKPQQDDPTLSTGYSYLKPQQDGPKLPAGYFHPRPQQDVPKPTAGYDYPNPQLDDLKPWAGYHYPAPEQDDARPTKGYTYPRPQEDDLKPSTGYSYPKPDDSTTSSVGYDYPAPLRDPQRPAKLPSSGYLHPMVQEDEPATSTWRPLIQTPDQDYLPPKGQLPLEEPPRPVYGAPAWSDHPTTNFYDLTTSSGTSRPGYLEAKPTKRPALQDELPFSHGQMAWLPAEAYLPPRPQHDGYEPAKSPYDDNRTPAQQPPRDDPSTDGYLPPKQPLRDDPPANNYLPPNQPARDDAPAEGYIPPKPPSQDSSASNYLPPKLPPISSYLPPKQPLHDHEPLDIYGSPKNSELLLDKEDDLSKSVQAQPRHLAAALRAGSVDEHGIRVTDMSCLRTAHRARFTATITSPRFVAWPPVLEAVPGGGAAPTDCRIIADPADPHHRFLVDLSNPDLTRCGVKGCSGDGEPRLCSRVLMPSLPGLRLASDPVLLLQCALQPASVSLLQQARITAAQPASARSAGVVHAGGERAPLHAQLQLYRRGAAGEFSRPMQPGGAVHLGDELQLRATIRRGDGWQSSRLSDVVVRRGSDAVHLTGADGCSNYEMRAVCPRDQSWLAGEPLVSLLTMRVFMFRGMQDGDQLVLTARVVACLDRADCKLSAETCEAAARHTRTKRSSVGGGSLNATSVSYEDSVFFVVRRGSAEDESEFTDSGANQHELFTASVILAATVLPSTVLLLYWCKHRKMLMRLNIS